MKKHRIVVPLKVEFVLELLKGKTIIFNDEVEIVPEVENLEEKMSLLNKLKYSQMGDTLIFEEIEELLGITKEKIKIIGETRIINE